MTPWPFGDLTINESEIRILMPPCPRLVILYEILTYFVAVSKSATILNRNYPSLTINTSIVNGIEVKWLALRKQPLPSLVNQLKSPIALTKIVV